MHSAQRRAYSAAPPHPQGILVSPAASGTNRSVGDAAGSYAHYMQMQVQGTNTPTPRKARSAAAAAVSFSAVKEVYSAAGVEVAAVPPPPAAAGAGSGMLSPIPAASPYAPNTPLSPLPSTTPEPRRSLEKAAAGAGAGARMPTEGEEGEADAGGGLGVERAMWMSPVRPPGPGDREDASRSSSDLYRTQEVFSPADAPAPAAAAAAATAAAFQPRAAVTGKGPGITHNYASQKQSLHFSHTILDGELLGGGTEADASQFATSMVRSNGTAVACNSGGLAKLTAFDGVEDWETAALLSSPGAEADDRRDRDRGRAASPSNRRQQLAASGSASATGTSASPSPPGRGRSFEDTQKLQQQQQQGSNSRQRRPAQALTARDKHLHVKYKALSIRQQAMMGALFSRITTALRSMRRMLQFTAFNRWIRACLILRHNDLDCRAVSTYEAKIALLQVRLGDFQREARKVGQSMAVSNMKALKLRMHLFIKCGLSRGFYPWLDSIAASNRALEDKCVEALLEDRMLFINARLAARTVPGSRSGAVDAAVGEEGDGIDGIPPDIGLGVRTRARFQAEKLVQSRLSYRAGFAKLVHFVLLVGFRNVTLAKQRAFYHIKLLTMHKRYLKIYTGAVQPLRDYIDYQEGLLRRVEDDVSRELYNKSTPFRPTTLWTGPGTGTGSSSGTGVRDPHRETLRVAQLRIHSDTYKQASLTKPTMFGDRYGNGGDDHARASAAMRSPQYKSASQSQSSVGGQQQRLLSPNTEYHDRHRAKETERERDSGGDLKRNNHRHKHRRHRSDGIEEDKERVEIAGRENENAYDYSYDQTLNLQMPSSPSFSAMPSSSMLTHMPPGVTGTLGGVGGPSSGQLQLSLHSPVKINDFSVHLNLDLPGALAAHNSRKFSPTARSNAPGAGETVYRELEDGPLKPHETYRKYDTARSTAFNAGYGHGLASGHGHTHGYGR